MVLPIENIKIIESLIPQRNPIVMVDSLYAFDSSFIESGFTVKEDNIFVYKNELQESGLIEHMAQSVALHTGYEFFLRKEAPPTGYIGAIKEIEIFKLPKVSEKLKTKVCVLQEFMRVTLVDIQTYSDNILISKGQMKTVIAE